MHLLGNRDVWFLRSLCMQIEHNCRSEEGETPLELLGPQSKSNQNAKAGKRERPSRDWIYIFIWLVEMVARVFWTNHRAK